MLNQEIENKLPQIIMLLKKHKIKNAFVFGSALTNRFNAESDIDFLVNIIENQEPATASEHLWDLGYELEDLLNRKVDLLTQTSLKNSILIKEIENTRLWIYGKKFYCNSTICPSWYIV